MKSLVAHGFHARQGAKFAGVSGAEAVADYGSSSAEYSALTATVGLLDLSFRGRLCVLGADRARFLHGQVTNDVLRLNPGHGCYAALVNARGKMESDLNIYCLEQELLLDFEPGLREKIAARLEKYIIADDVQVVDVEDTYGLLSLQGPCSADVVASSALVSVVPREPYDSVQTPGTDLGEIYVMNHPRLTAPGFDIFVPVQHLARLAETLRVSVESAKGTLCGWSALETARIEAGLPRYGQDMDSSNLPFEAGLEERAFSFQKGCYIGQEVLLRLKTRGQVSKALCRLRLEYRAKKLPNPGTRLVYQGKEVGYITSATVSPRLQANIALGYVRRERNQTGVVLSYHGDEGELSAEVVSLPFSIAEGGGG